MDQRIRNLAKILVGYSVEAGHGEQIMVGSSTAAEPLVLAVYEEILKAGAYPVLRLTPEGADEVFFKYGKPHHFSTLSAFQKLSMKCYDKSIRILADTNTRALSSVDPAKQTAVARAYSKTGISVTDKPWVLTLYPTRAYAQNAGLGLAEFEDFVFSATCADEDNPVAAWRSVHKMQARLIGQTKNVREVRILAEGTDLKMSVKGRVFINSDGHTNMPSGEIYTSPVEDSVEGAVSFDFPVTACGREVSGVRLVFRKGVVVEASADRNGKYLNEMLDTDPGARRLGELGIGTNRKINRFISNMLFDEKIGGTIHLALGNSYPIAGGRNKSAIHKDIIKDMRRGGAVYFDGKLFQKDGRFVRN